MSSLRLFGIIALDGWHGEPLAPETDIVTSRDIGAVVTPAPYVRDPDEEGAIERHHGVIASVFAQRPVLPAPVGVVFRTQDVLHAWLELHYVALHDALAFIEGRVMGRVYVRGGVASVDEEGGADQAAISSELFRVLRRSVVGAVPLRVEPGNGTIFGGSFLLERERWDAFSALVAEEERRTPGFSFEVTGPWPPYDFVRMQLGG